MEPIEPLNDLISDLARGGFGAISRGSPKDFKVGRIDRAGGPTTISRLVKIPSHVFCIDDSNIPCVPANASKGPSTLKALRGGSAVEGASELLGVRGREVTTAPDPGACV